MSAGSSKSDEGSNKSSKEEENNSSIKSKPKVPTLQTEAGTSNSKTDEEKKQKKYESWIGFFPPNMWLWKPVEPEQEVLLKRWSMASILSVNNKTDLKPQKTLRKTESHYIWPNIIHIRELQRFENQPTLDQLIEQRKLRENQVSFADDLNKQVDYLGERISSSKLNILIAQLNNLLSTSSEDIKSATRTLTRSKPIQIRKSSSRQLRQKASKASQLLSPEETEHRDQLRQNQMKEYENLREQMGLFGESTSTFERNKSNANLIERSLFTNDETISKTDLNKFISTVNEMPKTSKDNLKTLQNLIKEKPQLLKILRETHKKKSELLTPEEKTAQAIKRKQQIQELEEMHDQIDLYADCSTVKNITTEPTPGNTGSNITEETISEAKLQTVISQLNQPRPQPESLKPIEKKTSKPKLKETSKQKQLRQKQIEKYENLREQIGLYGERESDTTLHDINTTYLEGRISKSELNSFINQLKGTPELNKINKELAGSKSK